MTAPDLSAFLQTSLPTSCDVILGKRSTIKIDSPSSSSTAYVKYDGGLSFKLEGVRLGVKSQVKTYEFKNEFVMCSIVVALVLGFLDGERRV